MSMRWSDTQDFGKMETRYRGSRLLPTEYELSQDSYNGDIRGRRRTRRNLFPEQFTLLIVVGFIVGLFLFVTYMDNRLPAALTTADIPNNPKSFIEERARYDLTVLTKLGPRVCGSHANDIAAVDILTKTLTEIKTTASAVHNIEINVSKSTGVLNLLTFLDGFTSSYASVPLLTVKFEAAASHRSAHNRANNSILVNCHFDSVPVSPGASDDMVSCVTMIEVLRVLSRQPKPLRNTIIFLFNGAEENGMQGSHGFIAGTLANGLVGQGHPWSKNIRTFFNMEACGGGGREALFQTGPGNAWIVKVYAGVVPYPFGSAMGEVIFQSGIIPSDTDFRIFRDYAKIPGLDVAFIKNGWIYHTRLDNADQIPPGSLQHMGSNSLALIEALGELDFSEISISDEKMVYFDVFGLYMVTYSETVGIVMNVSLAILTLILAWNDVGEDKTQIFRNVLGTLAAWVAGVSAAVLAGLVLNVFKYTMPYYSYPSFALLIFGIPNLIGQVLSHSFALKGAEDHCWMGAKTTLAIIALATTFFTRATFALTTNIAFGIFAWFSSRYLFKDSQRRLLFYLIIGEAFPLAMSLYLTTISIDVFVPLMGRSGSETNPNVFVAVLTALSVSFPAFTGIVPIFLFFKKSFLRGATLVYILVIGVIVFGIGKTPYQEKSPMRLHIVDIDRTWYESDLKTVKKADTGYWFFNMDPNVPNFLPTWMEKIPEIGAAIPVLAEDCPDLYCAMPFFFPVSKRVRKTQWIPKNNGLSPEVKGQVQMEMTKDEFLTQSRRRVTLSFLGPDHLTIKLSPGPNYELVKWSLPVEIPKPTIFWRDRPTYFIFHGRGIQLEKFEVTLDFERKESSENTGPLVDINYSAFFIHGDNMQTKPMKEFLGKFPEWTHILGWSSVTQMYTIN